MSDVSTARLLEQLEAARIFDLSQPFTADMPQLPGAPRFQLGLLRRHGDTMRGGGYSAANELMVTIGHAGTHIDAIGHVSVDGRLYGGLSAEEIQRGTVGLSQLGIEAAAPPGTPPPSFPPPPPPPATTSRSSRSTRTNRSRPDCGPMTRSWNCTRWVTSSVSTCSMRQSPVPMHGI